MATACQQLHRRGYAHCDAANLSRFFVDGTKVILGDTSCLRRLVAVDAAHSDTRPSQQEEHASTNQGVPLHHHPSSACWPFLSTRISDLSEASTAGSIRQSATTRGREPSVAHDLEQLGRSLLEIVTVIGRETPERDDENDIDNETPMERHNNYWQPMLFEHPNLAALVLHCLGRPENGFTIDKVVSDVLEWIREGDEDVGGEGRSYRLGTLDEVAAVMKAFFSADAEPPVCGEVGAAPTDEDTTVHATGDTIALPCHLRCPPMHSAAGSNLHGLLDHAYSSLIKAYVRRTPMSSGTPFSSLNRPVQLFRIPKFGSCHASVMVTQPLGVPGEPFLRLSLTHRTPQLPSQATCVSNAVADSLEIDHRWWTKDFAFATSTELLSSIIDRLIKLHHSVQQQRSQRRTHNAMASCDALTSSRLENIKRVRDHPQSSAPAGAVANLAFILDHLVEVSRGFFAYHNVTSLHRVHIDSLFAESLDHGHDAVRGMGADNFARLACFPLLAVLEVCPHCENKIWQHKECAPLNLEHCAAFPYICTTISGDKIQVKRCAGCSLEVNRTKSTTGRGLERGERRPFLHAVVLSRFGVNGRMARHGSVFIYDRLFRGVETNPHSLTRLLPQMVKGGGAAGSGGNERPTVVLLGAPASKADLSISVTYDVIVHQLVRIHSPNVDALLDVLSTRLSGKST